MPVEIKDIKELIELLNNTNLDITDVEQLKQLFRSLNQMDTSPEALKEELAAQQVSQEREFVHQEKIRQLEHAERMRALELGHPLADPGTADAAVKMSARGAGAAGCIGVFVPLGMAAAAFGATWLLQLHPTSINWFTSAMGMIWGFTAVMGIIWGTTGLVSLMAVILACGMIRKQRFLQLGRVIRSAAELPAVITDDSTRGFGGKHP